MTETSAVNHELVIEQLRKDKAALEVQLQQHKNGIDGLTAQLDATKQMYNESITSCMQLRTQGILGQRANQELSKKNDELTKQVARLNQQLTDATAKISELTSKDNVKEIKHAANQK